MTTRPAVAWRAHAKINLTLHVTGQRADGYHLLDSLVCFADVCDRVTVAKAEDFRLNITGPLSAGVPADSRNLVAKAAALIAPGRAFDIELEKHLPAAAGIGGGSADAAATLNAISELIGAPLPKDALSLGADVPVCLHTSALRMQGVGEVLTPVPALPEVWSVLVNPRVPVETPPVFKALAQKTNPAMPKVPAFADVFELAVWLETQRNDLQAPARVIAPQISDVLQALKPAIFARMSGSGATCFGLCESQAAATDLAASIQADYPDWWCCAARLV